ncbi:MAG: hypothetical protein IJB27_06480 [Clostridia bacterium]|nr:hypothetical protein [Clostridia bacterium]
MGAYSETGYPLTASHDQLRCLLQDRCFAARMNWTLHESFPTPTGSCYVFFSDISMTSWSEKITITLSASGPHDTHIHILSKCVMPTQLVDWGKNKKNLEAVSAYILENLEHYRHVQSPPPPQPNQGFGFCRHCGTPRTGIGTFCPACGQKL